MILRGSLRRLYEGPIEVYAETAEEAVLAVTSQIDGFRPDIHGPKRIRVGGHTSLEKLKAPLEVDELHLFPQVNGGKNNGFVQFIIGVVLIVATLLLSPVTAAFAAMSAGSATLGSILTVTVFMAGVNLAIGGLIQMLFPAPDLSIDQEEASKYLGVPRSTVAIGTRIRVIYGKRKTGFHILSFGFNAPIKRTDPGYGY